MTVTLSDTPVLTTDRLTLRAPRARDWPAWRDFYMSERSHWFRPGETPDPEAAWRSFATIIGHWVLHGWGMFVMTPKDSDCAMGCVGPWKPEGWPEAEIAWSIWSADTEGKGYVSEAARAAIAHAFTDLGWATAVSYIDPNNARSVALAERLGAQPDPGAAYPGEAPIVVWRHPDPNHSPPRAPRAATTSHHR